MTVFHNHELIYNHYNYLKPWSPLTNIVSNMHIGIILTSPSHPFLADDIFSVINYML